MCCVPCGSMFHNFRTTKSMIHATFNELYWIVHGSSSPRLSARPTRQAGKRASEVVSKSGRKTEHFPNVQLVRSHNWNLISIIYASTASRTKAWLPAGLKAFTAASVSVRANTIIIKKQPSLGPGNEELNVLKQTNNMQWCWIAGLGFYFLWLYSRMHRSPSVLY